MTENDFPQARIQCDEFKENTRSEFVDKREYEGPICEQIEEAYHFVLGYCMYLIHNNYDLTIEKLNFLVKNNAIIPHGREKIISFAINLALNGQYYETLHILAPQIEYFFRYIARESGGITVTLEDDGTSKEKV